MSIDQSIGIATVLDVVALIPQLYDEEDNAFNIRTSGEIRESINRGDGQLRGQLKTRFPEDLTMTPYAAIPIRGFEQRGEDQRLLYRSPDNTKILIVLDDDDLSVSQAYTITFTDPTSFGIVSDLTGPCGTGTTAGNAVTTDGVLTIPHELWDGTFVAGNIVYVKVYNYDRLLVRLSALIAAVEILDSIYTDQVPNASAAAEKYLGIYNQLLSQLKSGDLELTGVSTKDRDIDPIQVDYEVSDLGQDITNYEDREWPATDPDQDSYYYR